MNYEIKKVNFIINNYSIDKKNIINSDIIININGIKKIYKIIKSLGSGAIGHVYLIEINSLLTKINRNFYFEKLNNKIEENNFEIYSFRRA